jgi:hypothetical protein
MERILSALADFEQVCQGNDAPLVPLRSHAREQELQKD